VSQALVAKGYKAGAVQTANAHQSLTTVSYGAGAAANAGVIAKDFGVTATESSSVTAGHVQVILGGNTTAVPAALGGTAATASPTTKATSAATPTPTSTAPSITTQNGTAVTVKAQAKYGIPCVY
jgi:hypothetical protein